MKKTKNKIKHLNFEERILVFEQIMELERKFGIYVPIKKLKSKLSKLKQTKKITEKQIDDHIQMLIVGGVIYIPRGGFITRVANVKEHFRILRKIEKIKKKEFK